MATPLSTVTHNIYNTMYTLHAHGDCQTVQIGTSNTINESNNQIDDIDLTSDLEDLRFEMRRRTEEMAEKFERKDEEITELKNRVADLEAFKKKVEQSEITTNTNTNIRHFKKNTNDEITLQLLDPDPCEDQGTITISKKDSFNGLIKLIEEKIGGQISEIEICGNRDGRETSIYNSYNNKKNDYSLEQLGIVNRDKAIIFE
ncbi:hypothetical protein SNE40_015773 [Patella caerulea]|uniref:Uncharacterized protein n=1 Tax=Patella caerulea TaxID=87958 RepID=A0AAN8JPU5_PATCE